MIDWRHRTVATGAPRAAQKVPKGCSLGTRAPREPTGTIGNQRIENFSAFPFQMSPFPLLNLSSPLLHYPHMAYITLLSSIFFLFPQPLAPIPSFPRVQIFHPFRKTHETRLASSHNTWKKKTWKSKHRNNHQRP